MSARARVLGAFVLAMSASAPSCAPSTFANLTGGESEDRGIAPHSGQPSVDPTLEAPRPISPLSVSWVNTSRPRLRWELPKGQSGAIVELSPSRDFKPVEQVKRFVGTGEELVVPEDLEPGFWFWRLKGRTEESEGYATSPVWEVLVRGPGRHGASDVPSGGINDFNGDGEPDLNIVGVETSPEQEEFPIFMTLLGQPGGRFTPQFALWKEIYEPAMALSGALDINGDGFSDFVATLRFPSEVNPESLGHEALFVFHGGSGPGNFNLDDSQGDTFVFSFTVLPRLESAGDVDGDGYGDVVASFEETTLLTFGSTYSLRTMTPLVNYEPSRPILPFTGVDLDGDGRSDIVRGALASSEPGVVVRVTSGPSGFASSPAASNDLSAKPATAFASGDFDGDGDPEVACATTIDGLPAVCVYSAKASAMTSRSCWISDKPLPGFGESLVAADIDEDGRDEILVPSSAKILVVRHEGIGFVGEDTSFSATSLDGSFVPRLALIHPGRPGKARWAVYGADRQSLHIFLGTTILQTFEVKDDPYLTRFGEDIR